ncbi:dicarboxylate/amino acid:cation symporter [Acinetobacter baumannii]|uniref:dicarboxylate/amino acid:cation symporter n=1 Tax=Acinetobacter baumannii TaxID=470 RepID=UPI0018DC7B97|nr:dicarboxylate/amino acid:cation symporter [Acinetobacter baumannii]MBH8503365.1 dicarboxylate/amino acid:cation symporter [Acinetobacter baumannii]
MDFNTLDQETVQKKQKFHQILYVQVIFAIILGILIGHFYPELGESLKPLGDAFIKIVKMIIAPVIFLTVVTGIASMTNMSRVGRVTGKAMLYFLTFSSLALVVGMIVANIIQPGKGLNIDPATLVNDKVNSYVEKAHATNITDFFMNIIPQTLVSPLAGGEILQVLFVAVLFGISLAALGDRARPITDFLNNLTAPVFYLVGMLMKLAPIGAFGAMAFTIGAYGIESIGNLLLLIMTFYITAVLFVLIILGAVARYNGFSIIDLIRYIKDELWLVLGTSSSEAALPSLMDKMQKAGCEKSVVGLVIPTGYSFTQACNVDLSIGEQVALLLVAMVSSKGAAGVTGAGFITLAATLSVVPAVPVAGMALILGIDRFMSECRALTNLIGNACATIVVARWDKALDKDVLDKALRKSKTN